MRQRLGVARALVADPALLVLDEPTNGLDPRGRREIHDLLAGLAGRGVGILLCTHLLDDAERLCTRAGVPHQPTRRRERQMQRFKSARHAQRFLSAHSRIHNHFQLRRHRLTANEHRAARDVAFRTWREVTGVVSAA